MASIINASSSGSGGIVQTADASGVLQLQTNGTNAVIVDASGYTTIGTAVPSAIKAGNLNVAGTGSTGNGWAGQFGNATGSIAVLAGVRSGIASVGTQSATTLALNPDGGQVTMPSQSAFIAYMSATSTAATIPFNVAPTNRNSNFNTSTYTYTAPLSGLYYFNLIITYNTGTTPGLISLYVNGGRTRDMFEANYWTLNTENHSGALMQLTAGDSVTVNNGNAASIEGGNNQYYSQFSGYFIG